MKTPTRKLRYALALCAVVLVSASVMGVIVTNQGDRKQRPQWRPVIDTLPPVVSHVKGLEVVSATINRLGEPGAVVAIEVRNNTDRAIVAVAVEQGDDRDAWGVNKNGYRGDEPPVIILEPHGTTTIELGLSNLTTDLPIRVAGVMYADGDEDGDEATLGTMRRQREHEKKKAGNKKGVSPQ